MTNYSQLDKYAAADASDTPLNRLYDYSVIANDGEKIGNVENIWMSDAGQEGFIAISTGWLFGRQCLIPTESLQVDHDSRQIRVPYTKDQVKYSPNVAEDYEVTTAEGMEVKQYYGVSGQGSSESIVTDEKLRDPIVRDQNAGRVDVTSASVAGATSGMTAAEIERMRAQKTRETRGEGDIEVPLSEESVRVGKREVEYGRVRLRKVIRTEVVNQPVELRREDVVIERIDSPTNGSANENAFTEGEIEIPLTREEAVVEKTTQVTGAVRVHKTQEAEQQNVSETVRKEEVVVDDTRTDADKKHTLGVNGDNSTSTSTTPKKTGRR